MESQTCTPAGYRIDPKTSTSVLTETGHCTTSSVPVSIESQTSAQVAAITKKALDKIP